jgi:hypothetical protein
MKKKSTTEKIKSYLQSGKSLTVVECLNKFGTHKLTARVSEFNLEGMNIKCDVRTNPKTKKRFGVYYIKKK